jgi:hypothetical protein
MMVPLALILQAVALPAPVEERPVRVWLGPSPVTRGEVMPVYVAAASAGYLLVLRARSDGKVEIVFPADPRSDGAIKRGAYELRGVGGKPAVVVNEPNGTGLMLAALSPTPFRVDEFLRGGAWHGGALIASWPGADGVGTLTDIVQRMLGDGWFNYDMAIYTVGQRRERRPLVAATPVASAAPAPADVSVCTDCTIVYQSAPPEPVVVETFVERTFSEPLVLLPRQRRPHHRRDAPKVKTEGICSIGIDCPEGIGQGKAISMRRPSLVMTRNYRPRAPVASPLAGGTVVTSNVIVAPPPPPPPTASATPRPIPAQTLTSRQPRFVTGRVAPGASPQSLPRVTTPVRAASRTLALPRPVRAASARAIRVVPRRP